jgi:YesN/AraC family two-component response regulator
VIATADGDRGLVVVPEHPPDAVITDTDMRIGEPLELRWWTTVDVMR